MFLKLQNQGQKSQVLQTYVLAGHVMSPAVYGTGSKGQQVMFVLCVLRVGVSLKWDNTFFAYYKQFKEHV